MVHDRVKLEVTAETLDLDIRATCTKLNLFAYVYPLLGTGPSENAKERLLLG
jgi:hypothetical protein